jgi:hypothetical protein
MIHTITRKIILWLLLIINFNAEADSFANSCSHHFEQYEKEFDLPKNLLSSVSIVETGRWDKNKKSLNSWPWTVNNAGKSYFFDNKQEAIDFVSTLIMKGHRNIDVGCMQVNLKHHPYAFENLYQAFEPKYNIAYAASLIKKLHSNSASWVSAIAQYHSGEKDRGINYAQKVLNHWYKKSEISSKTSQLTASNRKIFRTPGRNPIKYKNRNISSINKVGKI